MPIYEYSCTNCNHTFDLMQKINDKPVTQCPQCLRETAIRLISAAGFQLKGTGWYQTDFKNSGKPEPKKENKAPSNSEKKESSGSDKTSGGTGSKE